jgi:hypothetical protein
LSASVVAIQHGSVAFFRETQLPRDLRPRQHHVSEQLTVCRNRVIQRGDMATRNHEHMLWRSRVYVAEGKHRFRFEDDPCWNDAGRNITEDAVRHGVGFLIDSPLDSRPVIGQ